ncbi:MAG TPA: DNA replication/repair protein RecF [Candidatus Hydrogenedentes bacterium]|nr:DNA replication/repair protein RecF [Candidatus Hydrogenedentota bacterium]
MSSRCAMVLRELHAEGFRCLPLLTFAPDPGLNVIFGDNAQGKTSLLEAVLYAATSKSHRTSQETDLVQHGCHGFRIRAAAQRSDRNVVVEATWWRGEKRFKVNGVSQSRVSDILGRLPVVFFSPEDAELVRGTASVRRRFLDMALSQLDLPYLRALQQYRQALRQRNELLKQDQVTGDLLDAWDEQLVRHGTVMVRSRLLFGQQLANFAAPAYDAIATRERLELVYLPDIRSDEDYAEVLRENRDRDRRYGLTSRGPHRDDFELKVEGRPARQFASQGQQRSVALALKLAELKLVRERISEYPVLMLDDVLSELDAQRSSRLFNAIPEEAQCLITTTGMATATVPSGLACTLFQIRNGALTRA